MLKLKALTRLTFLGAAVAWLVMVFSDVTVLFSDLKGLTPDVPLWLPRLMLDLYVICIFYYYKFKIERDESLNFTDLLWRVFATGLVATVISLALRLLDFLLGSTRLSSNIFFHDVEYLVNLGLLLSFLVAAYTCWKRLILYQKSKWLLRGWLIFEIALVVVLLSDNFKITLEEWLFTTVTVLTGLLALVLSANMKWVAFLNFRQKWTSLLLLLLSFFYLGYFFYTVTRFSDEISLQSVAFLDFRNHSFNIYLFSFVMLYSIFSFLVILFNLPTSSVFEQKLEEVVNFQRISQSVQTEQNEESVYKILLESSVSSVFADAAWLEIKGEQENHRLQTYQITEADARKIQQHLNGRNVKGILEQSTDKTKNLSQHLSTLKGINYRSIMAFPVSVKGEKIGTLALLKELPEGFNKEMTQIVSAFANQAGISIENFRLLKEAIQNERYKEELKIAKTVQKSLLPDKLEKDPAFDISAFSESADEVGGDYYDTLRINDHQVGLIIADVSGKGTTAAFHMSQMKGIFHSLAQQALEPKDFMVRANQALKYCLERGSFISATYFVIDTQSRTIRYCRAGHCPVLFYQAHEKTAGFLTDKGVALGMVKGKDYDNYIETNSMPWQSGDVMVLFTDGITEAKNGRGDEFGLDLLKATVTELAANNPQEIQDRLIKKLYDYTGTEEIDDDYTTMIVKFH
ncbi:MAG: PP2C family protein-serine/threonine phosphatase [Cyclobacteriaceae bacterium]|nr:PP2C family protein-serine/threonine phosphatase [Cyclobacteriaceae bacterium]